MKNNNGKYETEMKNIEYDNYPHINLPHQQKKSIEHMDIFQCLETSISEETHEGNSQLQLRIYQIFLHGEINNTASEKIGAFIHQFQKLEQLKVINFLLESLLQGIEKDYIDESVNIFLTIKSLLYSLSESSENIFIKFVISNFIHRLYYLQDYQIDKNFSHFLDSLSTEKGLQITNDYCISKDSSKAPQLVNIHNIKPAVHYDSLSYSRTLFLSEEKNDYYGILLQQLHDPRLFHFLCNDIRYDLTKLSLQIQIHLLDFLWNNSPQQFESFKKLLHKIPQKNQESFLTTFLACSKNPEIGDQILELARYDGSEKIFEAYAELVNLQSQIDVPELSSAIFLKSILGRGEKLLGEALKSFQEGRDFEIGNYFSSKLVKSGALAKAVSQDKKIFVQEFNEADTGFSVQTFQGKNIITANDTTDMMFEENYHDLGVFSKDDFSAIYSRIGSSLEDRDDPELVGVIIEALIEDLQNPNSHFILLRNNTGELMGVCKIIDEGNGKYYYGTHYLHPDIACDFSLGTIIQKILENEVSKGAPLEATVKLDNIDSLIRHIEYSGGIGEFLHVISQSDFFHFRLNDTHQYLSKDRGLKTVNDFENRDTITALSYQDGISKQNIQELLETGYVLTRVLYNEQTFIFEKSA